MTRSRIVVSALAVLMILSLTFTSAGAVAPADAGRGVDFDWDDPASIYPEQWDTVFDKTPTFRFTQYDDVTKYRIKVRSGFDESIEYYTYKGTAKCVDFECKLTPDIPLPAGVVTFENDLKGQYQWTVEAKVDTGVWSGVQEYVDFYLGTAGFNSTFTTSKKGWIDLNGDWLLTSAGTLKNNGIPGEYTSTLYKKRIYDDFTYTVNMKLKSIDPRHFGGVIIDGNGQLVDTAEKKVWSYSIYVVYRNDGTAGIFVYEDGENIGGKPFTSCPSIVPGGWNKIQVTTMGDSMEVAFNGANCLNLTHYAIENYGYVGLTQYRYDAETEKMLVDWAKLEVDTP